MNPSLTPPHPLYGYSPRLSVHFWGHHQGPVVQRGAWRDWFGACGRLPVYNSDFIGNHKTYSTPSKLEQWKATKSTTPDGCCNSTAMTKALLKFREIQHTRAS